MLITGELTIAAEGDWVFVAESQGVTIHSREVVGHPEFEFRGSLIVNQPVEVIGAVLVDIPSFTRWFYKCTLARKVPDRCRRKYWKLSIKCRVPKNSFPIPGKFRQHRFRSQICSIRREVEKRIWRGERVVLSRHLMYGAVRLSPTCTLFEQP